ncbi:hypothetical protein [Salinithrix halophila]|uniref:Holin n=1 Tax=Salinithrix halophila TaxID=1485204 RepID=A0ABV8JA62_9BACL
MGEGVTITSKEMFSLIQDVARGQQRIEARLENMEKGLITAYQADERSRKALELAKDMEKETESLKDRAKTLETRQWWLWGAIALLGLKALFHFTQGG